MHSPTPQTLTDEDVLSSMKLPHEKPQASLFVWTDPGQFLLLLRFILYSVSQALYLTRLQLTVTSINK